MRTFTDRPLGWNVGLVEQYLMMAMGFFGLVTAYRAGAHIAVTTVYERLSGPARKAVVLGEVGMVTPPMGLNVFVVARVTRRPAGEVFRGALPFAGAMVLIAVILLAVPEIVLWTLS